MTTKQSRIKTLRQVVQMWKGPNWKGKRSDSKTFIKNLNENFDIPVTKARKIEAYRSQAKSKTDFMRFCAETLNLNPQEVDTRW